MPLCLSDVHKHYTFTPISAVNINVFVFVYSIIYMINIIWWFIFILIVFFLMKFIIICNDFDDFDLIKCMLMVSWASLRSHDIKFMIKFGHQVVNLVIFKINNMNVILFNNFIFHNRISLKWMLLVQRFTADWILINDEHDIMTWIRG